MKQHAPNTRLQRTRFAPLRSPLSRKPFGDNLKNEFRLWASSARGERDSLFCRGRGLLSTADSQGKGVETQEVQYQPLSAR